MTTYWIDPSTSTVDIAAKSTLHGIDGHADAVTGTLDLGDDGALVRAHVELEAERLRWGNPLLDRETRRRIDVRSHPTITGDVLAVEAGASEPGVLSSGGVVTAHLRGTIGFRGVEHEVAGDIQITQRSVDRVIVEGTQSFDVRDWGLEPPNLLLIRVEPVIRVSIHVEATAEEQLAS